MRKIYEVKQIVFIERETRKHQIKPCIVLVVSKKKHLNTHTYNKIMRYWFGLKLHSNREIKKKENQNKKN